MSVSPLKRPRDRGSVLIMVLVLMIIVALLVLPMLTHASTVFRANRVVSDKARRQEAVRAGLRMALAEPAQLYNYCYDNIPIGGGGLEFDGIPISTNCYFRSAATASGDDQLHVGLATTKVGELTPPNLAAVVIDDEFGVPQRQVFENSAVADQWYNPASSVPTPRVASKRSVPGQIWAPNLPSRPSAVRSAQPFVIDGSSPPCYVYFPGTYEEPVTLTGRVYFTSGIYYFEDTVTVTGQADVVVGGGKEIGCASDQDAAFYTVPDAPMPHLITGRGATFVFGEHGKLVITNDEIVAPHPETQVATSYPAGPARLRFNQRYVKINPPDQETTSFGVSIMSVNGAMVEDAAPTRTSWTPVLAGGGVPAAGTLVVPGIYEVPMSRVGGVGLTQHYETPRPLCTAATPTEDINVLCVAADACAADEIPGGDPAIPCALTAREVGFVPSDLTYKPRRQRGVAPQQEWAPRNVAATVFSTDSGTRRGIYVTWAEPEISGGLPIQYTATVRVGANAASAVLATPGANAVCTSGDITNPDPALQVDGGRECLVSGLNPPAAGQQYFVNVTARNALPDGALAYSESIPTVVNVDGISAPAPTAPASIAPPTVTHIASGVARVAWTLPTGYNPGTTRLAAFRVTARPLPTATETAGSLPPAVPPVECGPINVPGSIPNTVDPDRPEIDPGLWPTLPDTWYCYVAGLDTALDRSYTFEVVAENLAPGPLGSPLSSAPLATPPVANPSPALTNGCDAAVDYDASTAPHGCRPWAPAPRTIRPYEPDPIVDIRLTRDPTTYSGNVWIDIPGYIAVPQGVVRLYDPHRIAANEDGNQNRVTLTGGILGAKFRVRVGGPADTTLTAPIGLVNLPVQRTFAICTTTDSGMPRLRSAAIVQVNENGVFRVNSEVTEANPVTGGANDPCRPLD